MDELFLDPVPHTWTTPAPHRGSSEPTRPGAPADESSLDLYGDLSMSSIRSDQSKTHHSPEKQNIRHFSRIAEDERRSSGDNLSVVAHPGPTETCDLDLDIYTDHLMDELSLKEKFEIQRKELSQVKTQNAQLRKNISSLYLTAKHELQEKDEEIAQLKTMLEKKNRRVHENVLKGDKPKRRCKDASTQSHSSRDRKSDTVHGHSRLKQEDDLPPTKTKIVSTKEPEERSHSPQSERSKNKNLSSNAYKKSEDSSKLFQVKDVRSDRRKDDSSYRRRRDEAPKSEDEKTASDRSNADFSHNKNDRNADRKREDTHRGSNKYKQSDSEKSKGFHQRSVSEADCNTHSKIPGLSTSSRDTSSLHNGHHKRSETSSRHSSSPDRNSLSRKSEQRNEHKPVEKDPYTLAPFTDLRQKLKKRKLEAEVQHSSDAERESKRKKSSDFQEYNPSSYRSLASSTQPKGVPNVEKCSPSVTWVSDGSQFIGATQAQAEHTLNITAPVSSATQVGKREDMSKLKPFHKTLIQSTSSTETVSESAKRQVELLSGTEVKSREKTAEILQDAGLATKTFDRKTESQKETPANTPIQTDTEVSKDTKTEALSKTSEATEINSEQQEILPKQDLASERNLHPSLAKTIKVEKIHLQNQTVPEAIVASPRQENDAIVQSSESEKTHARKQPIAETRAKSEEHILDQVVVKSDLKENYPERGTLAVVKSIKYDENLPNVENESSEVDKIHLEEPKLEKINITDDEHQQCRVLESPEEFSEIQKSNAEKQVFAQTRVTYGTQLCDSAVESPEVEEVQAEKPTPTGPDMASGGQLFDAVAKSSGFDLSKDFTFLGPEISNQESNSIASPFSVPFGNVKSVDGNSVSNMTSTNQTWPFEASGSTQNSISGRVVTKANSKHQIHPFDATDSCQSNSSQSNKNLNVSGKIQLHGNVSIKEGNSFNINDERAFPISSSLGENLVEQKEIAELAVLKKTGNEPDSEENSGGSTGSSSSKNSQNSCGSKDKSSSDPGSVPSSTSCGSVDTSPPTNTQRVNSPDNAASTEVIQPNRTDSSSSSGGDSDKVPVLKRNSSGSHDTSSSSSAGLDKTPPKPRPRVPDEMGIICTSNLIMLGDEETTCTTFSSPHKSILLPSEFYPPGVRGKIHEGGSHSRHIRGGSEVVFKPIRPMFQEDAGGGGGRFKAIFEEKESKATSDDSSSKDSIIFVREEHSAETNIVADQVTPTSKCEAATHQGNETLLQQAQSDSRPFSFTGTNVSTPVKNANTESPSKKQDFDCAEASEVIGVKNIKSDGNHDSEFSSKKQKLGCIIVSDDDGDQSAGKSRRNSVSQSPIKKQNIDNVMVSEDGSAQLELGNSGYVSFPKYRSNFKIFRLSQDALASHSCSENSERNRQSPLTSSPSADDVADDSDDDEADVEQSQSFNAFKDNVEKKLLLRVKNQDLKTYKQGIINNFYSQKNSETQSEMKKSLENLRREFYESMDSSIRKTVLATSGEKAVTEVITQSADLNINMNSNYTSLNSEVVQLGAIQSLTSGAVSVKKCRSLLRGNSDSDVHSQALASEDTALSEHGDSFKMPSAKEGKGIIAQQENVNKEFTKAGKGTNAQHAGTAQMKYSDFGSDNSFSIERHGQDAGEKTGTISFKLQALRNSTQLGSRASPDSFIVTSSDSSKVATSSVSPLTLCDDRRDLTSRDMQLHREPDSTSDNFSSSKQSKPSSSRTDIKVATGIDEKVKTASTVPVPPEALVFGEEFQDNLCEASSSSEASSDSHSAVSSPSKKNLRSLERISLVQQAKFLRGQANVSQTDFSIPDMAKGTQKPDNSLSDTADISRRDKTMSNKASTIEPDQSVSGTVNRVQNPHKATDKLEPDLTNKQDADTRLEKAASLDSVEANITTASQSRKSIPQNMEVLVSPFKKPRHADVKAPPVFDDECSQFPSPVRPVSKLKTGNQAAALEVEADPNSSFTAHHSNSDAEDEAYQHTTEVSTEYHQGEGAMFAFDEASLCSHSLSEFDKDVALGSPAPGKVFQDKALQSNPSPSTNSLSRPFSKIFDCQKSDAIVKSKKRLALTQQVRSPQPKTSSPAQSQQTAVYLSSHSPLVNVDDTLKTSTPLTHRAGSAKSVLDVSSPQKKISTGQFLGTDLENDVDDFHSIGSEISSRHLSYQQLQEMRHVKTSYYKDCSSPINVLESTADESEDNCASPVPRLSKEEWQFLENVKRVRKNLNTELEGSRSPVAAGSSTQKPSQTQSPGIGVFSPCSYRTLSSDLFISESESEGFPSPVKKAKVSDLAGGKLKNRQAQETVVSHSQYQEIYLKKPVYSSCPVQKTPVTSDGLVDPQAEEDADKTLVGDVQASSSPVIVKDEASPEDDQMEEGEIEDDDDECDDNNEEKMQGIKPQTKDKDIPKSQTSQTNLTGTNPDRKTLKGVKGAAKVQVRKCKRVRPGFRKSFETEQSLVSPLERVYCQENTVQAKYNSENLDQEWVGNSGLISGEGRKSDGRNRNFERSERHLKRGATSSRRHSQEEDFAVTSHSRDRRDLAKDGNRRLESDSRSSRIRRRVNSSPNSHREIGRYGGNGLDKSPDLGYSRNRDRGRNRLRHYQDLDRPSSRNSQDRNDRPSSRGSLDQDHASQRDSQEKDNLRSRSSVQDRPVSIEYNKKERSSSRNSRGEKSNFRNSHGGRSLSRNSQGEKSNSRNVNSGTVKANSKNP
ncbi:hypothetical protein ElyMa_005395100 [Elysia marginata]|uniref:Uncharacterized protein n=1 Tax=Elysia marginata TaxID=1093978 RepID=A0AAV4EHC0_9GAST|nr:hypothetical protein ElyMa_005395100 [Elysia marginata]